MATPRRSQPQGFSQELWALCWGRVAASFKNFISALDEHLAYEHASRAREEAA